MRNKKLMFACMLMVGSLLTFNACSPQETIDKLMGKGEVEETVQTVVIEDQENELTINQNLPAPAFIKSPKSSASYELEDEAKPLSVEVTCDGEGKIAYQWYKNTVNSNGGGTAISGATSNMYIPDCTEEGKVYYYVVAIYIEENECNMATSSTAEINVTPTGQWIKDDIGWWYRNYDGSYPQAQWKLVKGEWYYFKSDGYMKTGWHHADNDVWYYLSESGAMLTGKQEVEGVYYYFDENGAMKTGWVQIDDEWYLFDNNGHMMFGWQQVNDKWYYMGTDGVMLHDTTIEGYVLGSDGAMK